MKSEIYVNIPKNRKDIRRARRKRVPPKFVYGGYDIPTDGLIFSFDCPSCRRNIACGILATAQYAIVKPRAMATSRMVLEFGRKNFLCPCGQKLKWEV